MRLLLREIRHIPILWLLIAACGLGMLFSLGTQKELFASAGHAARRGGTVAARTRAPMDLQGMVRRGAGLMVYAIFAMTLHLMPPRSV